MKKVVKRLEREQVEKRTHLGNGLFSTRVVNDVLTIETEGNKVYDCVYENGKLVSETDVTDYL